MNQESQDYKKWDFPEYNASVEVSKTTSADNKAHSESDEGNEKPFEERHADELQRLKKQAYQEAKHEAAEKFSQEWQYKITILEQLITQLQNPATIVDAEVEAVVVQIIKQLMKRLVFHEISLQPETLSQLVHNSISKVSLGKKYEIKVNEQDKAVLEKNLSQELLEHLVIDESLSRGECCAISETTEVDATLDERLRLLVDEAIQNDNNTENQISDPPNPSPGGDTQAK